MIFENLYMQYSNNFLRTASPKITNKQIGEMKTNTLGISFLERLQTACL